MVNDDDDDDDPLFLLWVDYGLCGDGGGKGMTEAWPENW